MSFAQNKKLCEVGDSLTKFKTEPVLRLKYFTISTPPYKETKTRQQRYTSDETISTTIASGGCRFILGPVGDLHCGCRDPRQCLKDHNAAVCVLTPKCFLFHDRFVLHVKRSVGIRNLLKESFPEISGLSTDAVLELGKKQNKGVVRFVSEVPA
jgi:hypothetical protein